MDLNEEVKTIVRDTVKKEIKNMDLRSVLLEAIRDSGITREDILRLLSGPPAGTGSAERNQEGKGASRWYYETGVLGQGNIFEPGVLCENVVSTYDEKAAISALAQDGRDYLCRSRNEDGRTIREYYDIPNNRWVDERSYRQQPALLPVVISVPHLKTTAPWRYETGVEDPNILGSGSSYYNVIHPATEAEAIEAYKNGHRNYLQRSRRENGHTVIEFYEEEQNRWVRSGSSHREEATSIDARAVADMVYDAVMESFRPEHDDGSGSAHSAFSPPCWIDGPDRKTSIFSLRPDLFISLTYGHGSGETYTYPTVQLYESRAGACHQIMYTRSSSPMNNKDVREWALKKACEYYAGKLADAVHILSKIDGSYDGSDTCLQLSDQFRCLFYDLR